MQQESDNNPHANAIPIENRYLISCAEPNTVEVYDELSEQQKN